MNTFISVVEQPVNCSNQSILPRNSRDANSNTHILVYFWVCKYFIKKIIAVTIFHWLCCNLLVWYLLQNIYAYNRVHMYIMCMHNLYYFTYELKKRFIITLVDDVMHYTDSPFNIPGLMRPPDGSVATTTLSHQCSVLLWVVSKREEDSTVRSPASF